MKRTVLEELRHVRLLPDEIGRFMLCSSPPGAPLLRLSVSAWQSLQQAAARLGYDSVCEAVELGFLSELSRAAVKAITPPHARKAKRKAKARA